MVSPGSTKPARHDHRPAGNSIVAPEQAALAVDHEHDRDRIGARKMLRHAGRAIAPPAALDRLRGRAAIRAEAVARMPAEQRLGFGERRQMVGIEQAAHRDRAQIGDREMSSRPAARRSRLHRARPRSRGAPSMWPRNTVSADACERRRVSAGVNSGSRPGGGVFQHHLLGARSHRSGSSHPPASAAMSPRRSAARSTRLPA